MMLNSKLWLRGAVDAMASLTYLTAVFHLPLGNATAINLASPLFITVFAIFFFKERVTFQRGALILLGFAGVLLVGATSQMASIFMLGFAFLRPCCMPHETR